MPEGGPAISRESKAMAKCSLEFFRRSFASAPDWHTTASSDFFAKILVSRSASRETFSINKALGIQRLGNSVHDCILPARRLYRQPPSALHGHVLHDKKPPGTAETFPGIDPDSCVNCRFVVGQRPQM